MAIKILKFLLFLDLPIISSVSVLCR